VTRTVRIGITGPIGCGKSQVAAWLALAGARVVDADRIAREVTLPGTRVHGAILRRFGQPVTAPDGTLDRAALGRIVFADPAALRDLEALVHPAVRPVILDTIADAERAGVPAVAVEAIKLVEGGLAGLCDEVWLVTCGASAQLERLVARGMPPADAAQRIDAQAGLADRLRPSATRVIDTAGAPAATQAAVAAALRAAIDAVAERDAGERRPGA
jgi:dephospho-CoA kinase